MTALRAIHAAELDRMVAAGRAALDIETACCAAGAHFCKCQDSAWRCQSCGAIVRTDGSVAK